MSVKLYLADTCVVSALMKKEPDSTIAAWMRDVVWYLPSPVVAEIQAGIDACPSPVVRAELETQLNVILEVDGCLPLNWDIRVARTWGRLQHSPEVKRQPQPLWDSIIDSMGATHNMVVATDNGKHFRHSATYDPWTDSEYPPGQAPA